MNQLCFLANTQIAASKLADAAASLDLVSARLPQLSAPWDGALLSASRSTPREALAAEAVPGRAAAAGIYRGEAAVLPAGLVH